MNLDPEDWTMARWGGGLGALATAAFYFRKMLRTDKQESSTTEVIVSVNGGTKLLIDEFRRQMADLAQQVRDLEKKVKNYFDLHEACQREMTTLRLENESLKRNQKP